MTYTYNPFEGKFDATQWTYASGILTTKIPSDISIPKDGVATGVNFGVSSYYIDLNAEGWDGAAGYDTSTRIINYQPVGGTVKGSLGLLFNNQLHFIITETDLAAVAPTGNVFGYGASVAPTGNGTKIIFRGGGSAGGNGAGGNLVFIGGAPNGVGTRGEVVIGEGTAGIDYSIVFDGETNDGIITWMEDEDYFKFGDDVNVDTLTASKPVWTDASKTLISKDNTPCDLVVTRKTANSMTVTTGTLTSGNVASTQTWQDGSEVHITEVTGVPGFDVKFVFTSIANFCRVGISAYYAGSATHVCQIQIYDHTNTTWRNLWHLPGTALGHNYRYSDMPVSQATILADYISGSDEVWIRFYHPTSGNASHDLYIDYVSIIGE